MCEHNILVPRDPRLVDDCVEIFIIIIISGPLVEYRDRTYLTHRKVLSKYELIEDTFQEFNNLK